MTKKVAKISVRTAAAAVMLLTAISALCGCQSDRYYQARAAERAREFLLENSPELSPEQVAYVKYNDPILLVSSGMKGRERGTRQICVTWDIPGTENLYMVFGAGRTRMDDWYPNRIIRKNFVSPDKNIGAAISECRKYAITNFYEVLSKSDLNIVRLSNPEIVETEFELRPNRFGVIPEKQQVSLQWKISDHRYVVFCGYSNKTDLANWKLNFAAIMPDYEANFVRGKLLKSPTDFNTPIYVSDDDIPSGTEDEDEEFEVDFSGNRDMFIIVNDPDNPETEENNENKPAADQQENAAEKKQDPAADQQEKNIEKKQEK